MGPYRWKAIFFLGFFILIGCSKGGTYPIYLRYQPTKEFTSLQSKIGPAVGIAPFKDERPDTLYIGIHTPLRGVSSYFKSDPFPLEKALKESLTAVLNRNGVKTLSISGWDGKPESLKDMETDSILMIEIKRFWVEGKAATFRNNLKFSIRFNIHLGVKKEGKVYTKNVNVEKEMTMASQSPERMERIFNEILTDIFDPLFSNPYQLENKVPG